MPKQREVCLLILRVLPYRNTHRAGCVAKKAVFDSFEPLYL